ncbi:hypothetical protein [Moorena sp. SIO3B2]|uniref:hypothetical protein n=1 Tax=Moorena sp. SIO3B2 TaxID=2607827 RepID=UPI0013CBED9B|nr:hypothetical protein [Moorena sp. SIO3B2]NEP35914.1 hypothetical protein [Moorena sp. SIO3B2]
MKLTKIFGLAATTITLLTSQSRPVVSHPDPNSMVSMLKCRQILHQDAVVLDGFVPYSSEVVTYFDRYQLIEVLDFQVNGFIFVNAPIPGWIHTDNITNCPINTDELVNYKGNHEIVEMPSDY